MPITESLELTIGPSIQDPVLDAEPRLMGNIFGLVPVGFDLIDEGIFGRSGIVFCFLALVFQVLAQLGCVPAVVRGNDVVIPILSNEVLQILAISWSGVWDVTVRQPSLEFRLVPFVVCCGRGQRNPGQDQNKGGEMG